LDNLNIKVEKIDSYESLSIAKALVYDKCGYEFIDHKINAESKEYAACSFIINGKKIEQRASKITPTKIGQFVAIWKRDTAEKTVPFDVQDDFDFYIITAKSNNELGQFIFPKSILVDKGIVSKNGQKGKNGIRVYPPWDEANNPQAMKTQKWQLPYFVNIRGKHFPDLKLMKKLLI
jgi:hypothetical protein